MLKDIGMAVPKSKKSLYIQKKSLLSRVCALHAFSCAVERGGALVHVVHIEI